MNIHLKYIFECIVISMKIHTNDSHYSMQAKKMSMWTVDLYLYVIDMTLMFCCLGLWISRPGKTVVLYRTQSKYKVKIQGLI